MTCSDVSSIIEEGSNRGRETRREEWRKGRKGQVEKKRVKVKKKERKRREAHHVLNDLSTPMSHLSVGKNFTQFFKHIPE